ncbi:hypothetical protein OAJ70_03850 [Pelagibacteraceae bacterium]|nr:hypothetical protein [Pelagibacteraceae bacterium]
MIYLIKIIFFLLISNNTLAKENKINEILFKINNKVFTNVDLQKRIDYVELINNNFKSSEFSEKEKRAMQDDYISSLIFYEYFLQNKIIFKELNNEVEKIYKKNFADKKELNGTEIKNFKFNIKIDFIRNMIIEKKLNLNKNIFLQEAQTIDLLYNYNLKYIKIKEKLINSKLVQNVKDRNEFNKLNKYLIENKINFFYKEKDINDNTAISKTIKNIIYQNLPIFINKNNGYLTIVSTSKNLESYEGVYVELINFKTNDPLEKRQLKCNNLKESIDIDKTIFKKYEYSKLNNQIKNNLKSINDYILFKDNNEYNYIILCDLTYDKELLENINFNKNVNSLVNKIQINFLKKYKNEYKFSKIK